MKRAWWVSGGILWFGLVFFLTWRWTFPSEAVGDRLRVEVHQATGGSYDLSLSDLVPWWVGARAENVVLYRTHRGERTPVFAFEAARARVGPFSLLRNQPRLVGAVQVGRGEVDYDLTVAMNERGTRLLPREVRIEARDVPLQDLAGLAGAEIEASGGLDLEVELTAEEGLRDAVGDVRIGGRDVLITSLDPSLTGGMDLGMEIPIDEVDIHLELEDGRAEVRTGRIRSSLVDVEIEGEITLREDLSRSTLALDFALELGEELSMFKAFLKRAEWEDGSFHYGCTGNLGRPICRDKPERSASASRVRPSSSRRRTEARPRSSLSDEERERRREEALERLRAARERRAARTDGAEPEPEPEGADELDEIGYEEDDEFVDEDLPPDEVPLDEIPLDDLPAVDLPPEEDFGEP